MYKHIILARDQPIRTCRLKTSQDLDDSTLLSKPAQLEGLLRGATAASDGLDVWIE